MSRKKFIERNGATCKNWYWSWSFINEKEKIIIFGAWDFAKTGHMELIFSQDWKYSSKNKKNAAFDQALEHIRLIEEESYQLKTFSIYHSIENKVKDGNGPEKIKKFKEELEDKFLVKIGNEYYAASKDGITNISEEVIDRKLYHEGAAREIWINSYERNQKARMKCIEHYGYKCQICDFDFEKNYGQLGKNYIHVHHIVPLSEIKENYEVNPIKDLIPVCPNCHAIIHRTNPALTTETLKASLFK
jgi:5-methylcytosine-specific restriction enzyme A